MAELQAKLAEISATVPSPVEPPVGLSSFAAGPRESLRDINVRAGSPGPRSSKPPPPTPPPTAPVPPLPSSLPTLPAIPDDGTMSTLSRNSLQNGDRASSLSSGRRSPRSTVTSMDGGGGSSSTHMVADPRLVQQIEEQDGTIKTLGRRLQHCEADLQANIDLVNTLEAALNDSERALRKSRLSANGQSFVLVPFILLSLTLHSSRRITRHRQRPRSPLGRVRHPALTPAARSSRGALVAIEPER